MKASELIIELAKAVALRGDYEVYVDHLDMRVTGVSDYPQYRNDEPRIYLEFEYEMEDNYDG